MFAAVGNHVVALHRDRIGGLALPAELEPGDRVEHRRALDRRHGVGLHPPLRLCDHGALGRVEKRMNAMQNHATRDLIVGLFVLLGLAALVASTRAVDADASGSFAHAPKLRPIAKPQPKRAVKPRVASMFI